MKIIEYDSQVMELTLLNFVVTMSFGISPGRFSSDQAVDGRYLMRSVFLVYTAYQPAICVRDIFISVKVSYERCVLI